MAQRNNGSPELTGLTGMSAAWIDAEPRLRVYRNLQCNG